MTTKKAADVAETATDITEAAVLGTVWETIQDNVTRYLKHKAPQGTDIDDLTQEVFLRLWNQRDNLETINNIDAWITTVAHNVLIDQLRKQTRTQRNTDKLAQQTATSLETRDVEDIQQQEHTQLIGCVTGMLELLTPAQQQAITLVDLNGMKQREAAQQLNINLATLKSQLGRGRHKLRNKLVEQCGINLNQRGQLLDTGDCQQNDSCGCGSCQTPTA